MDRFNALINTAVYAGRAVCGRKAVVVFLALLWAFLACLAVASAQAQATNRFLPPDLKDPCARYLIDGSVEENLRIMEPSVRKRIAAVYANSELTAAEKARSAFFYHLKDRLAILTKSQRTRVLDVLREMQIFHEDKIYAGVYTGMTELDLTMQFPEKLVNTEAWFFALTHEMEHIIQTVLMDDRAMHDEGIRQIIIDAEAFLLTFDERIYVQELAAMLAEYRYLNSLPKAVRLQMAKKLERYGRPEKCGPCQMMIEAFSDDYRNAVDYIANQHRNLRYSPAQAIDIQFAAIEKAAEEGKIDINSVLSKMDVAKVQRFILQNAKKMAPAKP